MDVYLDKPSITARVLVFGLLLLDSLVSCISHTTSGFFATGRRLIVAVPLTEVCDTMVCGVTDTLQQARRRYLERSKVKFITDKPILGIDNQRVLYVITLRVGVIQ